MALFPHTVTNDRLLLLRGAWRRSAFKTAFANKVRVARVVPPYSGASRKGWLVEGSRLEWELALPGRFSPEGADRFNRDVFGLLAAAHERQHLRVLLGNSSSTQRFNRCTVTRDSSEWVTKRYRIRVGPRDSYKTVAEAVVYFPPDGSTLDDAAKADLATLAAYTSGGLQGYMIEIAGYASSTGTKQLNQQLSEARAENVAKYLQQTQNVPMRRVLVPAGYGATHPDATNSDPQGRALNRRVDVKVIVNKGLDEGT